MYFSAQTVGFYDAAIHENIPQDAVEISTEEHAALLAGQVAGQRISADPEGRPILVAPPPPTAEQMQASFTSAIQARLDAWARTRNYDGILSACSYAASSVPKFQAEGQRAVDLRDQTWAAGYEVLADVMNGQRAMPTSLADIEADLPALEWPQ